MRLLSKGRTPEIPEPDEASESGTEALLRTHIPETLQAIGDNLDRTLSVLQRMEGKLGAFQS